MSATELVPLFPSATHPAIPIASQILSTLRHLTAPGKGNDLKPEERAALVGISALLGCERVQSNDLIEKSAQKASSVSPAHFRSALSHARRILSTVNPPSPPTPSKRSTRASSSSNLNARASSPTQAAPIAVSPFQTPKKKFKYSSGVDLSGLVRSPLRHEPVRGSPLKQSAIPGKSRDLPGRVNQSGEGKGKEEADGDEEEGQDGVVEEEGFGDDAEVATPTKKAKYATQPGVDLESAVRECNATPTSDRKTGDTSAFFALRPGSAPNLQQSHTSRRERQANLTREVGVPEVLTRSRPKRQEKERKREKLAPRRDWTYPEAEWGDETVQRAHEHLLDQIWTEVPAWLVANHLAPVSETIPRGSTVLEVLLHTIKSAADEELLEA